VPLRRASQSSSSWSESPISHHAFADPAIVRAIHAEFRIHAVSRPDRIPNPVIRLGFRLFGRRDYSWANWMAMACQPRLAPPLTCMVNPRPTVV
jgi:hypothetical protein